ncbi:hypothetical protein GCM10027592_29180 [Spirosoma flavus]
METLPAIKPTAEQKALSALQPSVNLTTAEREAIAMWTSDPPRYPQLTEEECDELVRRERIKKGQLLYQQAYAKKTKGIREFPQFTAKSFREFIKKRGDGRAEDLHWKSGQFDIDADNEAVLKILSLYFTKDERFLQLNPAYSLYKGIYLAGNTGVGKTQLMSICDTNPHVCFTQHDCQIIANEYTDKKEGGQSVIDYYITNMGVANTDYSFGQAVTGRFFDDLGQEDIGNHWGNVRNVMAQIIEGRYRMGAYNLTHFTSNHTIDELEALYGPRVPDRLREMCNLIEYPSTAKSRR